MKLFFRQYSYNMVRMFVYQFAISIFGFVLALATTAANNPVLTTVVSLFAIFFYLFLIYTMTWEIGAKDRISVDIGKQPYRPHTGILIALFANIPNILVAVLFAIATPFKETQVWAGNLTAVLLLVSAVLEGMYRGLLSVICIPGTNTYLWQEWWSYFLVVIPALITSWIAYFTGFKNFRILAPYFSKKPQQGQRK
ncbi:MAG: hypothetical protein IJY47_01790 [Clostridia bacterium]|nr:hypothetical protein [Clostridia bacterium]